MMFMVMVLNPQSVWAAFPFIYETKAEAWTAARAERGLNLRIVEIVGEIDRTPNKDTHADD